MESIYRNCSLVFSRVDAYIHLLVLKDLVSCWVILIHILRLRYDSLSSGKGVIMFAPAFSFSLNKLLNHDVVRFLGSVPNKHVLLHLEKKSVGQGIPANTTILHVERCYTFTFAHLTLHQITAAPGIWILHLAMLRFR